MLGSLAHLALEVKYLDPAATFYREHLDLTTVEERDRSIAFDAGGPHLVLRAPGDVPRGGLHTHYALATGDYDDWYGQLSASFDLVEHQFGESRSLYFYDTEGNCVEIGERGDENGITGLFEVVLEVEDLPRAESFYTDLGFEPVDRGSGRERVRLTTGALDIELWEPHLGLADARGGVHVDLGVYGEPAAADRVREEALTVKRVGGGVRLRDPDGHYLTLVG